jgi:hypothetical protein
MFSTLRKRISTKRREPFGKAGLTVAVIALVMALVGGAYAAGGLTKSQEKQVTKIAKKYAGKPGAPGATGPAGPAGSAGAAGKNGTNGTNGKDGSPWTAGGTLPSGQTETGTWGVDNVANGTFASIPISFNVPLSTTLEFHTKLEEEEEKGATQVHYILANGKESRGGAEETQTACQGSAEAPKAKPGNLCVYVGEDLLNRLSPVPPGGILTPYGEFVSGSGKSGAIVAVVATTGGNLILGSWAVTAP